MLKRLATSILLLISAQSYANQWYLQGQAGSGGMVNYDYGTPTETSQYQSVQLNDGVAWRGAIGYSWSAKKFNTSHIGVELGLQSYGNNRYIRRIFPELFTIYRGHNIDAYAVFHWKLLNKLSLQTKLGLAYIKQRYSTDVNFPWVKIHDESINSTISPKAALALSYHLTKAVKLNITIDHIFSYRAKPDAFEPRVNEVSSTTTYMLGISYLFPSNILKGTNHV